MPPRPITIALVDDYEVVLAGLLHMFEGYAERVKVVELDANEPVARDVDIVLYDTFAQAEADHSPIEVLVANPHAGKVVVYTWAFDAELIELALAKGARGYLAKTMPASELVAALEAIHAGEVVVSSAPLGERPAGSQDWPGRAEGLTARESEIVALITQGYSNREIAELAYLSINSIKTHIRTAYRKMGVASRTQAVLWGIEHGFRVDTRRLDVWRK